MTEKKAANARISPRLTREAIYAALAFAADTLRMEVTYPLDQAAHYVE